MLETQSSYQSWILIVLSNSLALKRFDIRLSTVTYIFEIKLFFHDFQSVLSLSERGGISPHHDHLRPGPLHHPLVVELLVLKQARQLSIHFRPHNLIA